MMRDTDVLVVGGGPVGLAAAIEARLAGLDAIVLEPRAGAIDKACGEGLMPGALPALERLGVEPGGVPFHGIAYDDGRRRVEHRFTARAGRGVRRPVLHAALRARVDELGIPVLPMRLSAYSEDADGIVAGDVRASWLLGCDGLHSTVARVAGLARATPRSRRRYGLRRHFAVEPWSDLVEVHWSPLGELYVTPVGERSVGVALLGPRGGGLDDAIAAAPALAARLVGTQPASELRGAGPLRQSTVARVDGRVLLVGDAAGYVDALTGEGLRLGFEQAAAAVAAIAAGTPGRYERAWDAVTRDVRRLTGALARLASSPVRGAVVPAAAALPRLFAAAVDRLAR